jgi:hypothetical protein
MSIVSVIVPVHNGAEFVAEAVDSALAQTHRETEVVVVDDGSTDATPSILARYGSRLTVIRQPNRGLAAARNRALQTARGELVGLLDADDRWDARCLELGIARLAGCDRSVVGAFCGWRHIDRVGRPLLGAPAPRRGTFGLRELVVHCFFHPSTVLLRRDDVLAAGGFDETLPAVEDWDLWLRLAARCSAHRHRGGAPSGCASSSSTASFIPARCCCGATTCSPPAGSMRRCRRSKTGTCGCAWPPAEGGSPRSRTRSATIDCTPTACRSSPTACAPDAC